jgi:hypothetical protein
LLKWSTWFDTFFSRASASAVGSLEIENLLQSRLTDFRPMLPARLRSRSDMSAPEYTTAVHHKYRRVARAAVAVWTNF